MNKTFDEYVFEHVIQTSDLEHVRAILEWCRTHTNNNYCYERNPTGVDTYKILFKFREHFTQFMLTWA